MKRKPIYRLGKKHPSRSLFISEKDPRNSTSCISHPGENCLMVKYKEVSEKSEMKELIKNSNRLPHCFTIRSRHKGNSLHELFKKETPENYSKTQL